MTRIPIQSNKKSENKRMKSIVLDKSESTVLPSQDNRNLGSILVIDDNEHVRQLLRDVLDMAGYQVFEAKNGEEGLKELQSKSPALVIVDMIMPDMDGTEVIRKLRQEHERVKIIAISGGLSSRGLDVLDLAQRFGATKTIKKPFEIRSILDTVHEVLSN